MWWQRVTTLHARLQHLHHEAQSTESIEGDSRGLAGSRVSFGEARQQQLPLIQ
jgi:hypothetical protein